MELTMTPTDETYEISPSSVIASDHWCLEDALMILDIDECCDAWNMDKETMQSLFKNIQRKISVQGYPDAETFHELVLIAYAEITK